MRWPNGLRTQEILEQMRVCITHGEKLRRPSCERIHAMREMLSSLSPVRLWKDLGLHDLQTPREGEWRPSRERYYVRQDHRNKSMPTMWV